MKRRALLAILLMVFVACIAMLSFGCTNSSDDGNKVNCNAQMHIDKREWFKEDFIAHWDATHGTGAYRVIEKEHNMYFDATPEEMGINYVKNKVFIYTRLTSYRLNVVFKEIAVKDFILNIKIEDESPKEKPAGYATQPYQKYFVFVLEGISGYRDFEISYKIG